MQNHVSGKKHQKLLRDKKCVEGITIKAHRMSWDDVELKEEVCRVEAPTKPDKKPSAWSSPRSTRQVVAFQKESWSSDGFPAMEGSKAAASPLTTVRPRPRGRKVGQPTDKDRDEAARKLVSIPEAAKGKMSSENRESAPVWGSVDSTKDHQTDKPVEADLQLLNKGEN